MIHPLSGEPFYQPYGRDGECNYSIDRSLLNKFWLNQAEEEGCQIFFDHAVSSIDITSGSLSFQSKTSSVIATDYSAILGADGGGSVVRNSLASAGLISATESLLPAGYKEVVFPANPQGQYTMDPHALHIWARKDHMLMALANTDGSFTGTIYMDRSSGSGTPSFESVCESKTAAENFLIQHYPSALAQMNPDETVSNLVSFKEGILGTVRCSPWSVTLGSVPICLIGDAAHAIVPFFGQGVNCGFEDVYFLNSLMDTGAPIEQVLGIFSDKRKRDTDAIAQLALDNFEEMRNRVADEQFNEMKKLDQTLMTKFPNLYRTRYTLVMYSYNSYSACWELGKVQEQFLLRLMENPAANDQELEERIKAEISPHIQKLGIEL